MEFFALEPWGFGIEDVKQARLSSVVAQSAGAKMEAKDFLMQPPPALTEAEIIEQEHEEMVEAFRRAFAEQAAPPSTPKGIV